MNLDKLTTIRLLRGHNTVLQSIADQESLTKADIHRKAIKFYIDWMMNTNPIFSDDLNPE